MFLEVNYYFFIMIKALIGSRSYGAGNDRDIYSKYKVLYLQTPVLQRRLRLTRIIINILTVSP